MELTASGSADALAQPRRLTARIDPPAIAAWTLAFSVVVYLALSNGGYDTIVRSQVGIAVWWIVLLGALTGVLPMRIGWAGWVAIGLLGGFAVWTGLAATWSESAERSIVELGRVAAYLGVLVLAIALQGRAAARHTINGLACAIGLVTLLAVLSRLHPQWFPANDHAAFLGEGSARKLSYPLNYWNALAAFAAIGAPLLLAVAVGARTLAGQAAAAAALPLSALCVYLTISRGGALALVVGLLVFGLLTPRRVDAFATLLVTGVGSAILIIAGAQRDAWQDASTSADALAQGTQMLWLAAMICVGVALVQVAAGLAARHLNSPRWASPSRRSTLVSVIVVGILLLAGGVAGGAPGWVGDRWQEFKAPAWETAAASQDNVFSRLQDVNSNSRYDYWRAAIDANATDRWRGIGPGTFEFWWARHGTTGFVRDAHTLYLETLAETGIPGFALLVALLTLLLAIAVGRSLRGAPGSRLWIAAATGGLAAFLTTASVEWVWELAAVACVPMLLGAVVLAGDRGAANLAADARSAWLVRVAVGLLAAIAIGAVAVPMAGALATRDSRAAAAENDVGVALKAARTGERAQPYAASPHLQRALVLERTGAFAVAAEAASAAARREPTNWRPRLVLARIEARLGHPIQAIRALREARRLNPRSPLVGRTG